MSAQTVSEWQRAIDSHGGRTSSRKRINALRFQSHAPETENAPRAVCRQRRIGQVDKLMRLKIGSTIGHRQMRHTAEEGGGVKSAVSFQLCSTKQLVRSPDSTPALARGTFLRPPSRRKNHRGRHPAPIDGPAPVPVPNLAMPPHRRSSARAAPRPRRCHARACRSSHFRFGGVAPQ